MARTRRVTVDDWLKEELRDEGFRLQWNEREAAYARGRETGWTPCAADTQADGSAHEEPL